MRIHALVAIALLAVGCRSSELKNAAGDISFVEGRVDLGHAWEGVPLEGTATIRNHGRSPLTLDWSEPGLGFSFEGLPTTLPSGDVVFRVRFDAREAGFRRAVLTASAGSDVTASLELIAEARAVPQCTPSACHAAIFDKVQGKCVETPLPDGDSCDPQSLCVQDATCQAGRCIGTPITCDDGNACTQDTCNALRGCEFPPAPPCPGDGKCQVGVCNPQTGCELAPAVDGTTCGAVSCDAAEVCISGACVVRDPPDGYICAEASPCQGEGVCQQSACVRPAATALKPSWSFDSATVEPQVDLHDFVLEPDGTMSLMGFFSTPVLRANKAAVALAGTARRCIVWNGQLACADYSDTGINGQVSLLDFATGQVRWTFNLGAARPDFAAESDTIFMARIAAMGTDRIAALFESYPRGANRGTECRNYYLVVLNAGGQMVTAQKLTDPMLSQCNHPHPYGVAADLVGNLYLTFSPSSQGGAPLAAQSPTLLLAYSRDGVEKWRRTEAFAGGELGVANGLLYPEGALTPHRTDTGAPVATISDARAPLGRVVASDSVYVTSPQATNALLPNRTLSAWLPNANPAWTYTLGEAEYFLSRELRAVTWTPRPTRPTRTAVLGFAHRGGAGNLLAVDLQNGAELWSCQVEAPIMSAPQLFEVAHGKLTVMGGALTCGDCDPPFANSAASFWSFNAPGISPASVPWSGTFGGPGHDHLENGPASVPAAISH